jgi:hypothetical protein
VLLRHSNVSIQQGERRYSFTQFTAGGLFRWVYNGNKSDKLFYDSTTDAQLQQQETNCACRWEQGLNMYMVYDESTQTYSQQS